MCLSHAKQTTNSVRIYDCRRARKCVILRLGIGVFAWPPSCALSTVQSLTSALIVTRPGEQWWISLAVLLERAFIVGGLGALSPFGSRWLRCDSARNSLPHRGYKNRIAAIISWLTGILTLTRLGSFKSYRFSNRLHSDGKCASSATASDSAWLHIALC